MSPCLQERAWPPPPHPPALSSGCPPSLLSACCSLYRICHSLRTAGFATASRHFAICFPAWKNPCPLSKAPTFFPVLKDSNRHFPLEDHPAACGRAIGSLCAVTTFCSHYCGATFTALQRSGFLCLSSPVCESTVSTWSTELIILEWISSQEYPSAMRLHLVWVR